MKIKSIHSPYIIYHHAIHSVIFVIGSITFKHLLHIHGFSESVHPHDTLEIVDDMFSQSPQIDLTGFAHASHAHAFLQYTHTFVHVF